MEKLKFALNKLVERRDVLLVRDFHYLETFPTDLMLTSDFYLRAKILFAFENEK